MKCDVKDLKGNNCPEKPTVKIMWKGKQVNLCYRCHNNVLMGAYGKNNQPMHQTATRR
jgi:hypothetical protein